VIDLSDQSLHDECFCCVRCGRGFPELKFVREGGEFYHLIVCFMNFSFILD